MIRIKIIYDNRVYKEGFEKGWGFSCLIESNGKNLLFDTGGNGEKLIKNLYRFGVDIDKINVVTFSHNHWDHTGGIEQFLDSNRTASIYIPYNFPGKFEKLIRSSYHKTEIIGKTENEIIDDVFTTPVFNRFFKVREQALVIKSISGLNLITGCAHPGILYIVRRVKNIFSEKVKLVLGGFHLKRCLGFNVKKIVKGLIDEGVEYFAPCHCTGDKAIDIFKNVAGDKFIRIGSGMELEV